MIPAVLPPPRVGTPPDRAASDDGGRFDDALREVVARPEDTPTPGSDTRAERRAPDHRDAEDDARATTGSGAADTTRSGEQPRPEDDADDATEAASAAALATAPTVPAARAEERSPELTASDVAGTVVSETAPATAEGSDDTPVVHSAQADTVAPDTVPLDPAADGAGDQVAEVTDPEAAEIDPAGDDLAVDTTNAPIDDTADSRRSPEPEPETAGPDATSRGAEHAGKVSDEAPDEASTPARRPVTPGPADASARAASDAVRNPTAADTISADAATAEPQPAAPSAATVTATTSAAPAPDVAGPHPPLSRQLVEHVTPLLDGPDGTHDLTIELRPATLGRVQLEVTLERGVLHVQVNADDPASRRLLAQALGDLRAALTDAGITAGHLDVGERRGNDRPDGAPRGGTRGRDEHEPNTTTRVGRGRTPLEARSALDVLL